MGKTKDNQVYDKEEIKNRRERDKEKRRSKREKINSDGHRSDYRRRRQHDSEESRWEF